jgi:hypothetical protein
MSNQVYGNDVPPTPNVYVGQLARASSDGGLLVKSLTISSTPSVTTNSSGYLVRDPDTGLVMTQDATSVPDTGFTLRNLPGGGQTITTYDVPTLVLFSAEVVPDAGVAYAAGVFSLLYSGLYTACFSAAWDAATANGTQAGMWFELLSQGVQRFAHSMASTFTYSDQSICHTGTFSFIAEAGDELRVFAAQNDGVGSTLRGADSNSDITSISITRISPFVPPV